MVEVNPEDKVTEAIELTQVTEWSSPFPAVVLR